MRHPLFIVFVLAFLVRLGYTMFIQYVNPDGIFMFDSWGYLNIAKNLFENGIFTQMLEEPFTPDSTRTPLYPFFIYLFHEFKLNAVYMMHIQALISAFTILPIFATVRIAGFGTKGGIVTAGLFVMDPVSIFFSNTVMTETLFVFFLSLSIYSFSRAVKYHENVSFYGFVIFCSVAALCRPVALYLIPLLGATYALTRGLGFGNLVFNLFALTLLSAIFLGPWFLRNKINYGEPFFSSIGEVNLLFHTATQVRSKVEGRAQKEIEMEYRNDLIGDLDWHNDSTSVNEFRKRSQKEVINVIKAHPYEFALISAKSSIMFFIKPLRSYFDYQLGINRGYDPLTSVTGDSGQSIASGLFGRTSTFALVMVVLQILMLLAVYLGITLSIPVWWKESRQVFLFLSLVVLYFMAVASLTEVDARFRLPVHPILFVLAAPWLSLKIPGFSQLSFNEKG